MDYWPLPPPKLIYRVVLKTDIPRCCSRCPKKLVSVLGKIFGITKIDMEKYGGGFIEVEGPVEGKVIQRLLNDKLCKNVYMVESELVLKNFKTNNTQGGASNRTLKTVDFRRTYAPKTESDQARISQTVDTRKTNAQKPEPDQATRRTERALIPSWSDALTLTMRKVRPVAETRSNKSGKSHKQGSVRSQGGVVISEQSVDHQKPDQSTRWTERAPSSKRFDAVTEARKKGKAVAETGSNKKSGKSHNQGSVGGQGGVVIIEPSVVRRSSSRSSSSSSSSAMRPRYEVGEGSRGHGLDYSSSASSGYWTPQYVPPEEIRSNRNRNNGGNSGGENITYYGDFEGYGNHDHYQSGYDPRGWSQAHYNVPPPPEHGQNHPMLYFNEENAESNCTVM